MMGNHSFQSFFYLCSIIKETPRQTLRKKRTMNHLIQSLKEKITDQMSLEDMVNVFEEMCGTPFDEEMILFETRTFTRLSNEPLFQISLVRQVPNDDEEFYQVHLDIFYKSTVRMQSLVSLYGTKILMRISLTIFGTLRSLPMLKKRNTSK